MVNHSAPMLGMGVADALGMPFETRLPTDSLFVSWTGAFLGSAYHRLGPGQYTDDTQMALALARAIVQCRDYSNTHAADEYLRWYEAGPRGIGRTVQRAMERLKHGEHPARSGHYESNAPYVGNGVSMRIAPLGVMYQGPSRADPVMRYATLDAAITHDHVDAAQSAAAIALAVGAACHAVRHATPTDEVRATLISDVLRHVQGSPRLVERLTFLEAKRAAYERGDAHRGPESPLELYDSDDAIGISALALYIVAITTSYEQAVLSAIRVGRDTDTRGAICGAIAGALYGVEGIPMGWREGVEDGQYLCFMDGMLSALGTL